MVLVLYNHRYLKSGQLRLSLLNCTPTLHGHTPTEVYFDRYPASRKPRLEPRDRWPRSSPCARPWTLMKGKAGVRVVRVHEAI
jgi:hypothetical protein